MIDHPNVMPMSVPKEYQPKKRHSLQVFLVVLLVLGASAFVYINAKMSLRINTQQQPSAPEIPVVSLPDSANGTSIFDEDTQKAFAEIQARIDSEVLTREEGERLMRELFEKVPPPAQTR